uniref:(northern house mosquito) hypothetical protein n=1 Tax=Culex pipiens TaxID=7175 RepID=A0A8D8A490_CULPI
MLSVSKNRIAVSNLRLTLKKVALNKKEIFITTVLYFTVPHMFPNAVKSTNKKQNSKQAKKHFKYTIDGHFKTPNKTACSFFFISHFATQSVSQFGWLVPSRPSAHPLPHCSLKISLLHRICSGHTRKAAPAKKSASRFRFANNTLLHYLQHLDLTD